MATLADLTAHEETTMGARAAIQFAVAKALPGHPEELFDRFAARTGVWGRQQVAGWRSKAATPALDTTGALGASQPYAGALAAAVDRVSALGALKRAGAVQVPPNVTGTLQVGNATAVWTGELGSKAVASLAFTAATFPGRKLTTQVVVSRELLFLTDSRTQDVVTRAATSAIAAAADSALFDAAAASASRPAGLLNGVGATTLSGTVAEQAGLVLNALAGGAPANPVLVTSLQTATRLMAMVRDLAAIGVTLIITPAATTRMIGIDASGLLFVDAGIDVAISEQADAEMSDAPSEPDTANTFRVSMFQRNLASIRAERILNWRARADAVAWGTVV